MGWWYKPYVSAAARRAKAKRESEKCAKGGEALSPVVLTGTKIATTFWGKAWCDHLESFSDFASRLPRGRAYVRNGSVIDLQLKPGRIDAKVCGSSVYTLKIDVKPLAAETWKDIRQACAGQIASVVELLKGGISNHVMEVVTRKKGGLFPSPGEIEMDCSCPDWADMCKHLAAVLYGVGARLDEKPELLFTLRGVDHLDLISQAGDMAALTQGASDAKTIAESDLSDVFGIDLTPADAARSRRPRNPGKQSPQERRQTASDHQRTMPLRARRLVKSLRSQRRPPTRRFLRYLRRRDARNPARSNLLP